MAGRIPSLDGLRAISIAMVLLGHMRFTTGFPLRWIPFGWGPLGVTVVFVISGYLITFLLKERAKTGAISLRAVCLRRTIRIFPAFYVLVVLLLQHLGVLELRPGDALAAGTYSMNFRAARARWLGHTWSLSVEEQFYLLWPATLVLLGVAGGLRVALGAMIAAPLFRAAIFYGWPSQRPLVDQAFPLIFDGLATGCALAILRERLWKDARYRRLLQSPLFALVPFVVIGTYLYTPSFGVWILLGGTIVNVGIALCIDWAIRSPATLVGRALNTPAAVWVGSTSYSLYIWQQLLLCPRHDVWFTSFPLNIVLTFAAASLSYSLVEQPMMRLRARLGIRSTRRGRERKTLSSLRITARGPRRCRLRHGPQTVARRSAAPGPP